MMAVERERVSIWLTEPFLVAMDRLVRTGLYPERQAVIRAALRLFFEVRGIPPFYPEVGA